MEAISIVGGQPLRGEITVSGSKNAILPIMAATLLVAGECTITGVPPLNDVLVMLQVLQQLGAEINYQNEVLRVTALKFDTLEIGETLMRQLRASNLVLGALLSRCGYAKVSYPGGCSIGARPMDLHLKGFRRLGARVEEQGGWIEASSTGLQGTDIHLDFPSVGATENLMMAAVYAEGVTSIRNAAKEPEIVSLQNFLNRMGAKIRGAGLDTIRVEGVKNLQGRSYQVIPDRIEAGTHLVAAAITGGNLLVRNVIPAHLGPLMAKLREAGMEINEVAEGIRACGNGRPRPVKLRTLPYPGFPTDMQPQVVALTAIAQGTSVAVENIFENRFRYIGELQRMGAEIQVEGKTAIIQGVKQLSGTVVQANDLRAAAALVMAGLVADGTTVILGVEHLDRGYHQLEAKYQSVGASIQRVSS